jgi:hypothetical protein
VQKTKARDTKRNAEQARRDADSKGTGSLLYDLN